MAIRSFKDLRVWQLSYDVGVRIYKLLQSSKEYVLRDQLQRSCLSIPSNIAEGFDRTSNKEYIYFLKVARGSCSELRTQLEFAKDIGVIDFSEYEKLNRDVLHVAGMLQNLIKARKLFKSRDK